MDENRKMVANVSINVSSEKSKQRVMKALNFCSPDRIPIYHSFAPEFTKCWQKEKNITEQVDINDYYGIDIAIVAADETLFPSKKGKIKENEKEEILRDGWGRVIKRLKRGYFSSVIERDIKEKKDIEKFKFDSPLLDIRYEDFTKNAEDLKKKRCVFCKIGGPFHRTSYFRGEEEYLIDLVSDKPFAKTLTEKVGYHLLKIGLESLKRTNLYNTGIWIYDDMAANDGSMFSPQTFKEIFLPVYTKMVRAFKRAGSKKVILHSDGNIIPLLDMLIEAGIDGINPVEHRSGMDVCKLIKKYGKKLALIGGVSNSEILPKGNKKEIENHIKPILEMGKKGGIIIGSGGIEGDISVKTFDYYHSLIEKFGRY